MTQPGSSKSTRRAQPNSRASRKRSKTALERDRLNALLEELTAEADRLGATIRTLMRRRDNTVSTTEREQRLEAMRRRRASILVLVDRVTAELDNHGVSPVRNLFGGVRRIEQGGSPGLGKRG